MEAERGCNSQFQLLFFTDLLEFCDLYGEGGDYRMLAMARFESSDVERHPVVKEILSLYKETE